MDYPDEISALEEELGPLCIYTPRRFVSIRGSKRIQTKVVSKGPKDGIQIMHIEEIEESISGGRKPLLLHGLLPLLILKNPTLFDLVEKDRPKVVSVDNHEADLYLEDLIEISLFLGDSPDRLVPFLRSFPDWTPHIVHEIRKTFAQRHTYAPDYLMMSFQYSEMKTDNEIEWLVSEHFKSYKGDKPDGRRRELNKKIKQFYQG